MTHELQFYTQLKAFPSGSACPETLGFRGASYPNPANDFVIVEYTIDKIAKEVVFLVYDMQGRLQITQPLKNLTNQSLVDISKLTNATYQCKILIDGHQKAIAKIIVQH